MYNPSGFSRPLETERTWSQPGGQRHAAGILRGRPVRGGISHFPKEFAPWEEIANGVEVLFRTVLLLDERLNGD